MISKKITYNQLASAIISSFSEDKSILSLYDPNVPVASVQDIQVDILKKLKEFGDVEYKGVFVRGELAGYYVKKGGGILISFALAPKFRVRSLLRRFFSVIKADFEGCFVVFLWAKNERAVRYMLKNGMQIITQNENIIQLATK